MIRESHIEKTVCRRATAAGWQVHPKAAAGTKGWPDRTFSKVLGPGEIDYSTDEPVHVPLIRIVFVEFKAPGKKPTKLQAHTHEKLRKQGYEVYVIDSIEAGAELFA